MLMLCAFLQNMESYLGNSPAETTVALWDKPPSHLTQTILHYKSNFRPTYSEERVPLTVKKE